MKRGRRLLRGLLAGLVSVTATATVFAGSTASALDVQAGSEAFNRLSSCIGNSNRLLVMLLVDESGSLKQTDPTAQRVAAARVALSGLQSLAASSGVMVDVHLAGFSVDYRPVGAWTRLSDASLGQLNADLGGFAARQSGLDTDYFVALRGARQDFAARTNDLAQDAGAAPCKALLWFTDGKYDIEDRTTATKSQGLTKDYAPDIRLDGKGAGAQLVARGRSLLCDGSSGLVDGLRDDDIEVFTIPLATQIAPSDLSFLRAISNGADAGTSCGQRGSDRSGVTLDVKNLGELLGAFDRTASEIGRGVRQPGPDQVAVCGGAACPEGRQAFDIDDTVRRFHILSRTGGDAVRVILDGPARTRSVTLEPGVAGSTDIGGGHLRWSWPAAQAVTIDAEHNGTAAGWDGTWALTFVDPTGAARGAAARSQIYLFGDLVPTLASPQELRAGETNRLEVGLVSERDGHAAAVAPDAQVDLTVTDPTTGTAQPVPVSAAGTPGRYTAAYTVPADVNANEALVTVRLVAHSRSGIAFAPVERAVRLPIRIAGLPTVRLEHDRLAALRPGHATTATVVVQADPNVPGCVWLAGSEISGPGSAGKFSTGADAAARDAGSCLRVAAGETRRINVGVKASGSANGTAHGTLRLGIMSDSHPEPRFLTLAYQAPMTRPIDAGKRIGVFLALLLPGILLPLLIAYAAAWWTARFQPIRVARSAVLPVIVTPGRVERIDEDGNPTGSFTLEFDDFDGAVPTLGRFRTLQHRGHNIDARTPRSPFASPYGEVARPGTFAAGAAHRSTSPDGRRGLALPGQWVLTVPEGPITAEEIEEGAPRRGEILLIIEGTASAEDLQRISADIERRVPPAGEVLAAKALAWWSARQAEEEQRQRKASRRVQQKTEQRRSTAGPTSDRAPFDAAPFDAAPFDDGPPFDNPPFDNHPPFDDHAPRNGGAPFDNRPSAGDRSSAVPPAPVPTAPTRTGDDPPWGD